LDKPDAARRRATDGAFVVPVAPRPYPAWRYHETQGSVIVKDEAEDKNLGAGWGDKPAETIPVAYPSWRFHKSKPPQLVTSPAEEAALGEGWYPTVTAAAGSVA
jgi:hypothetical protein